MDAQAVCSPFSHPLFVMLKPAGARCNLACRYCYYLDKAGLYPDTVRHQMSDELLEEFTRQYIAAQTQREVLFTWHGGETLLRPLSFYQKALKLQQKYANGHLIDNCLQTNGTLLTDEWCRFLKDNNWLVGVSIDGPQRFHDAYRRDQQDRGTFQRVMQGIERLNRYGVEWNAMAVVNRLNADHPHDFYQFFRNMGCHYIQFTPIVEPASEHAGDPGNGASSCVLCSTSGCAVTWAITSFSCSMPRSPTGWVWSQASVPCAAHVAMPSSWSGMAMSTHATISCHLSISWAIF